MSIGPTTNLRFIRYVFSSVAAALVYFAIPAGAQSTISLLSYDSFDIIITSNIFDSNRPLHHTTYTQPPAMHDSFALVGTMSYSKGKFAFFDSPKSEYKKVLEPGATIAGYTVKNITPKNVVLAADTNEFAMAVGARMEVK